MVNNKLEQKIKELDTQISICNIILVILFILIFLNMDYTISQHRSLEANIIDINNTLEIMKQTEIVNEYENYTFGNICRHI